MICKWCGEPVRVMAFHGTHFCCNLHRKAYERVDAKWRNGGKA